MYLLQVLSVLLLQKTGLFLLCTSWGSKSPSSVLNTKLFIDRLARYDYIFASDTRYQITFYLTFLYSDLIYKMKQLKLNKTYSLNKLMYKWNTLVCDYVLNQIKAQMLWFLPPINYKSLCFCNRKKMSARFKLTTIW